MARINTQRIKLRFISGGKVKVKVRADFNTIIIHANALQFRYDFSSVQTNEIVIEIFKSY